MAKILPVELADQSAQTGAHEKPIGPLNQGRLTAVRKYVIVYGKQR